jgi:multidrug efflux pump subunit AcrA (membrane-fusion protein)
MAPEKTRLAGNGPTSAFFATTARAVHIRRGWFYASVPSLFLLGLMVYVRPHVIDPATFALPAPVAGEVAAGPEVTPTKLQQELARGIWPVALTYVVQPAAPSGQATAKSGVVLRGRLEKNVGVRGRAPLTGQVSRVLVKPGQRVAVNDKVLELSAGPTSRGPSAAEFRQNAAESAQVRAVSGQEKLQSKMMAAQERLVEAQSRVAAAQKRVEQARDVVGRLQRGESVTLPKETRAERVRTPERRAENAQPDGERQRALRLAKEAQQAADRAQLRLTVAENEAKGAEAAVKANERKAQAAHEAMDKAQKSFDAETIKASELDAARSAAEDADGEVKTAQAAAQTARKKAVTFAAAAKTARSASEKSGAVAAKSLEKLQVFAGNSAPDKTPEPEEREANDDQSLTVLQAASMVRSAVQESESAAKEARIIKEQVDNYDRQVRQTRAQLDSSNQQLESAQEQVVDQNIQANLSVVRAPANGVVLSVANIAQEVSVGDVIITLGSGAGLTVRWNDTSGIWRRLSAEQRVKLTVQPEATATNVSAPSPGAVPVATAAVGVDGRVTKITPPEREGGPAVIEVSVANRTQDGRMTLSEGMLALFAPDAGGVTRSLVVPTQAILAEVAGMGEVAVLQPDGTGAEQHRIEWRRVKLGTVAGTQREIASGLQPGERIALYPSALRALEAQQGSGVSLRLSADA